MRKSNLVLAALIFASVLGSGAWLVLRGLGAPRPDLLAHGRLSTVPVFMPSGRPNAVVVLFSGPDGFGPASLARARALRGAGAMVIGVDLPRLEASLDADDGDCVFPDGDLENLSRFVQAYERLATYRPPILAGVGEGAAFAYAMLAQAPPGTFAGAVGVDFRAVLALRKPLCPGSGVLYRRAASDGHAELAPQLALHGLWSAVAASENTSAARQAALLAGFAALQAKLPPPPAAATGALDDLPLTEMPAAGGGPGNLFAIILSGDGGWAGLDRQVGRALVAAGIPVVGLDSLRYFWGARTPEGLARDLDRMIRDYRVRFGKSRVLLVGYSQGADVLPFAVNRLSAAARSSVALVAMLGLSKHALFEFHLSNWVSDDDSGLPTRPEVMRLAPLPAMCVYGVDEDDSACPSLDPAKVHLLRMPGGHHFGGNYQAIANRILALAKS